MRSNAVSCTTDHFQRPMFRAANHPGNHLSSNAMTTFLCLRFITDKDVALFEKIINEGRTKISKEALSDIDSEDPCLPERLEANDGRTLNMRNRWMSNTTCSSSSSKTMNWINLLMNALSLNRSYRINTCSGMFFFSIEYRSRLFIGYRMIFGHL